jgi:hypothetical protein
MDWTFAVLFLGGGLGRMCVFFNRVNSGLNLSTGADCISPPGWTVSVILWKGYGGPPGVNNKRLFVVDYTSPPSADYSSTPGADYLL